jgi:hypothetical protein
MAFGDRVHYGQIVKTYNVVDLRKDPAHRYSPGIVVSVDRERITGQPATVSTSFVERLNDAGQTEQAWPSPGHPHHQGAITAM